MSIEAKRCGGILGDSWLVIVGLSISKRGSSCGKIIVVFGIIANDGCTPLLTENRLQFL
jgi:hypothetical protein